MYSLRHTRGNSFEEMLDPAFRKVKFTTSPQVMVVARGLRRAWITKPPQLAEGLEPEQRDKELDEGIEDFMRSHSQHPEREWREHVEMNPDKDDYTSPWRMRCYRLFNHVFADTYRFLAAAAANIGDFNPPCDEPFALQYPNTGEALEKTFDNNVFMLPVYLDPGVKVRLVSSGSGEEGGVFDESNSDEIWWIQGGKPVRMLVEGDFPYSHKGVAAVMAICVLGPIEDAQVPATASAENPRSPS